jgi:hypothetical protein
MSDSLCGLSADTLYATLKKYGDLTAHELAALCKVSLRQVLCAIHHEGYNVEAFAWNGPSWKYRQRPVLAQRIAKPFDPRKEYANSRISYPQAYT